MSTAEGKKDPQSPATTSLAYDQMLPHWDKMESVLGGTSTMRAAGTDYLPKHEEESDRAYQERLNAAVFLNLTKLTLDSMVGRPFGDRVKLSEDMPENIETWLDDADLQGNGPDVFFRNWFREGLAKGMSHVLVDHPRVDSKNEDGSLRTLAQDRQENIRPYLVHVRPENLFFGHAVTVDSREVLTQVRIHETIVGVEGFAEVEIEQIRQLLQTDEGVLVRIYRVKDSRRQQKEWVLHDEFPMGVPFIPLVTFYADRQNFMISHPPLLDLADLNIAHWQSGSDQRAILTVARFPMLASSGAIDADKMVVGPHQWLNVTDPAGRFYYVEHSGNAIGSGRQDMVDLEEQMAEYGAMFLRKQPGSPTATARALDSAEATSPLQDITFRFMDAANNVLNMMGAWINQEENGTLELETDFGPDDIDQADLVELGNARRARDLSREAYLNELIRRGLLGDEFSIEINSQQLENELVELGDGSAETEIDPQAAE